MFEECDSNMRLKGNILLVYFSKYHVAINCRHLPNNE